LTIEDWRGAVAAMKAIVGLGNPGKDYEGTRHNVGFEVIDELARRWHARLKSWKSIAEVARVSEHDVMLVKPKTYMNLSGQAVRAVTDFYHAEAADLLVIVDEAQLPLGRLRLRISGSAGGHNGLKSVIEHIGKDFPRLRIGVERGDRASDLSDRVLSRFPPAEREVMDRAITRAADAAEAFVHDGIMVAMNRFNAVGETMAEEETS
jgi:PTH1 family peptidyl-tRNA hydrolase